MLSTAILGDRLPLHTCIAIVLGFLCVVSIFLFSTSTDRRGASVLGDVASLTIAITLALYFIAVRFVTRHNGGKSLVPVLPIGCFLAAAFCLVMGADPFEVTARDMLWLWLMGGVMAPVAIPAFTLAASMISAPECSLIQLLEMVLGPLWTWLVLGEVPSLATAVAGACLVVVLVAHSLYAALHVTSKPAATEPLMG